MMRPMIVTFNFRLSMYFSIVTFSPGGVHVIACTCQGGTDALLLIMPVCTVERGIIF